MWGNQKFPIKSRVMRELFDGEPIAVRHDTPQSLTPDGETCFGADEIDFKCFSEFWYFSEYINKIYADLSEPFRLQELGDTTITGSSADSGPAYGRRYDIYYNQCKVGLVEITADMLSTDGSVWVEVNFNRIPPRILPFSDVYGFLATVASLVTSTKKEAVSVGKMSEYENAVSDIKFFMLEAVWQIGDDPDDLGPDLSVSFSGRPDRYYELLRVQS